MHAGRKRSWAQARRRGGGSGSDDDDLDMRVGAGDDDSGDEPGGADVASMSAPQLRSWLTARGADHELCDDREDLVRCKARRARTLRRSFARCTHSWRSRARYRRRPLLQPTTSQMRWTPSWPA